MSRWLCGWLFVFLVLLFGTGCEENANSPGQAPQNVAQRTKTENLHERVRQKWEAMASQDWKRVYAFFAPGIRKLQSEQAFAARMQRSALDYKKAEIQDVACQEDACEVTVKVFYVYQGLMQALQGTELDSLVHEKWIRKEGEWWFVPE